MNTENPLLITSGFPAFDRIQPADVQDGIRKSLQLAAQHLQDAEHSDSADWNSLMTPLEKIDLLFEYGWSAVSHLLSVANSDELREAHEAMLPDVVQFGLRVSQSQPLYAKMCALRDSTAWPSLASAQQRILTRAIQNAELSGIGLQGAQRERFNEISQQLSQLASDFQNNVLDATKAWHLDVTNAADTDGWPASLRRLTASAWSRAKENADSSPATPEAGPWRVTLDAPCFGPFMEHCRNRVLRETVYRAYVARAAAGESDNTPLIQQILTLRKEKAALLGFRHHADVSLSQKMAGNTDAVQQMFERLLSVSLPRGRDELAEISDFAAQNGQSETLAHWDVGFWAERLREQRFSFTDEELRPYFSLDRVLRGLFDLCRRLFGITVRAADGTAPVWNSDVRYFEIDNERGDQIAGFYLDPYSRPENKRGGAWMNDCIARSASPEGMRLPVAHLVCNSTPPVGDVPSLMTFREVETLFHEFGHGLQHMLTTVNFRDAAGISGVEWDAVELPSQFMENWCYHRPTLLGMAVHYETGETLPDDMFEKICRARTYRAASQMLRQLQFGMTDMELHSTFDPNGVETAFDVHRRIAEQTSPMPLLPENRFLCSFQHIFAGGYSAGYYSYKWAEVLSADAFSAFEEAGLDDESAVAETGRRFRDTILAQGGSRHPMEIYRDFRGREPSPEALLRHNGLLSD
ncbi:MAG: M3 family metallopeptidase [Planctomycetaceae bacterium]